MSSFDFITAGIRFSYSSTSTFTTCPYAFKLNYIDLLRPRMNNFYAEFGTFIHDCMERYFSGELEMFELSQYYRDGYDSAVATPPPDYPAGLAEKYRAQGQAFFDFFMFDKSAYDVVLVEDMIDVDLEGSMFTTRPDLVLRDKKTGKLVLYDYKTAVPFWESKSTGKEMTDTKKMNGFYKQMYVYTYALRTMRCMPIDEIVLWFIRIDKQVRIPCDVKKEKKAVLEIAGIIKNIRDEEEFPYNNSNNYFCENICGVRNHCRYRDG